MRGAPLHGGSRGRHAHVLTACAVAVTWLGSHGVTPASAGATPCANAALRSGASAQLPDCRAYEQVSPVEKGGLDAVTLLPVLAAQASPCEAEEACAIAYANDGAAFAGAQGNELPNSYRATRTSDGWETTPMAPAAQPLAIEGKPKVGYAFSSDLSQAVLRVPLRQLTEGAPAGVYNLYLRQASGAFSLLTTSAPPSPPQPGCGDCVEQEDVPAFAGASSDFSHVIFEANDSLVAGAPGEGVENLYEAAGGRVGLVGILPDGHIPSAGASAGGGIEAMHEHSGELEHAISQDGSRVLFEAAADGGGPDIQQAGETELYDRIDGASTVEISAPAPGARPELCETAEHVCDAEPAKFWAASADGTVVYFTSKAALTRQSNTGSEKRSEAEQLEEASTGRHLENPGDDLYRYDLDSGTLTDLSVDRSEPNGASVLGVVGASEDGSYVYFLATGALAGAAESGAPNLYVWHQSGAGQGTVGYIATLQGPSVREQENLELMRFGSSFVYRSDVEDWSSHPTASQAYVTPDGRHLAFMSVRALTGYNNEDAATGEADHEVFEYSAEAAQLVCASCDPSGAPPLGGAFIGAKLNERASAPFHQPRSLSDDGSRLFFSSPDPLVPGIAGGDVKLFEYEDGAAQLISGTEGGGGGTFLDASASGNDVFFATREQLAPGDQDEMQDVYDARVEGGIPAPPASPPPCQGSACGEPLGAAPTFATPISASFLGSGDLAPVRHVALTRKQLLSRALARCRKLKRHRRHAACIAAARRRYAPKAKAKARAKGPARGASAKRRQARK